MALFIREKNDGYDRLARMVCDEVASGLGDGV